MRERIASACPVVDYYDKLLSADRFYLEAADNNIDKVIENVRSVMGVTLDEALVAIAATHNVDVKTRSYCMDLLEKVNV